MNVKGAHLIYTHCSYKSVKQRSILQEKTEGGVISWQISMKIKALKHTKKLPLLVGFKKSGLKGMSLLTHQNSKDDEDKSESVSGEDMEKQTLMSFSWDRTMELESNLPIQLKVIKTNMAY